MDKKLRNREKRLRYRAKKKGLCIKKERYGEYSGYLIIKQDSKFVVGGYNHPWKNLMPIEEAEAFIAEY